jgi:LacI family transcriptional regulator
MKQKRLALSDIARQLNISTTTISFIINGKAEEKRISPELKEKVLKKIKELGYVPNQLAKSLRTGKTNIIGLIVEDISNSFFARVAHMIEEEVNKRGYKIIYCSSENSVDKMTEVINMFRESQVDGFIITPTEGGETEVNKLMKDRAHLILFDRYFPGLDTNYVVLDNSYGSYIGVQHLVQRGYKKIGFVTIDSDQSQMVDRYNGYAKAIKEAGLKPYVKRISFFDEPAVAIHKMESFLNKKDKPDAVFFATNYLGIYGLEAITNLKLKIPADIGVITFDDHDLFRLFTPSITVIAQPIAEMSKAMINILLDEIAAPARPSATQQMVLRPSLVVRNSTKQAC